MDAPNGRRRCRWDALNSHSAGTGHPLLARNGHADSVPQCPLSGCRLNRSTQHWRLKRKDGVYGDASRILSRLQKGARFIGVFASLSEQGGTPAQRAAKTSEFETPAEI